MMCSEV